MLQDLNFGSSYGLKLNYIKSQALNPASAGFLRLGYDQNVSWRNNANSGDLSLNLDSSDNLQFNSTKIPLSGAIVNSDINASAAITYSKLALSNSIVNNDINSSAAITYSKLALSNSIVNNDINSSAAIAYSKLNIADADLSIAKTSGLQSALDAKLSLSSGSNNQTIRNNSGTLEWSSSLTIDSSGNAILGASGNKSLSIGDVANGFRVNRNTGANGISEILHYGTGAFGITAVGATGLAFATNNTTRMEISAAGNVGIGITSSSYVLHARKAAASSFVAKFENTTASGDVNNIVSTLKSNAGTAGSSHFRGETESVGNWYLLGNGTHTFTSDIRRKKNVETARNGYLDDLLQLRVVKYNWNIDEDGTPKEIGLIAQEVEQIFPGLIREDTHESDGIFYKGIKNSVIPYMLLKAIQELNAKVDEKDTTIATLIARIEALENA